MALINRYKKLENKGRQLERFIKVKDKWIDCLEEMKQGNFYFFCDNYIWLLKLNEIDVEEIKVGKLQEESSIFKDN